MARFAFLTHMNRTGSTFLAKLLDEYQEINVSLEASIPDNITIQYGKVVNDDGLENFLDLLYADVRFKDWQLDRDRIKSLLKELDYPLEYRDILQVILSQSIDEKKKDFQWVIKRGEYINHIHEVLDQIPEAKFLYIVRDPRAVYNSQKFSRSLSNRSMATSPVSVVLEFKNKDKILQEHQEKEYFHVLYYENLIRNKDNEVNDVLDFLEVKNRIKVSQEEYASKIPEKQQHLHANITKGPMVQNINKWKKTLTQVEIKFINIKLKKILKKYNYPIDKKVGLRMQDYWKYLYFNILFYYILAKRKLK